MDHSTFIDSNHKALFIDKDHGEWWAIVSNVINKGSGHTKRRDLARAKRVTVKISKEDFDKLLPKYITIVYEEFSLISKPCTFIDDLYGKWKCEPSRVLAGSRHPKRSAIENPQSKPMSVQKVKEKLLRTHGNSILIKEETYFGMRKMATFIHEFFGEWCARPYAVISGQNHPIAGNIKRKNTMLDKYGVENGSQNTEIALKIKSSNISTIKYHWKSGKEIVCQGGYESKVVDHFNANQTDFHWQPKTFTMPNGKTYRPDAYLPEQDLWIEIKGYMRPDAQIKWDWFKSEHPTAELWDQKRLKKMRIL